jgi:putative transposase
MSRFRKLTHAIWHCKYHIVWTPKYRFRILEGETSREVAQCIRVFTQERSSEVVELNVQYDHVHLIVLVPPKISISELMGRLKGRTAIRVLKKHPELRKKRYWGNHFWAPGYCVDTIGLDEEAIRRYVRFQEKKEREVEQMRLHI